MTKLNDLQSILLASAAQRDTDSLLLAPDTVVGAGARLTKAVAALVKRGLAEERETSESTAIHRTDGDLGYGMFITEAGSIAIGVGVGVERSIKASPPAKADKTPRATKAGTVLALLQREQGATLTELIEATGWLPHTIRAALTGLRKKNHAVERTKRGEETCYRIGAAEA